ncbi:C6 finger domain protein, putative [Talaromyces stipitatus ATCC 10500]|uniref:C6 finger domain protein, putative n=1 Tax=Talaromyces stipitatus (strain ATCC 10500 / CBS 375.48 / QM 6759 / NRRL 1006) TaxID=441959 RepID=B8MHM8_TALSN|nr:C6 finger domain protein, putative [Talaromyces stipitatus ATCC 10500]EED16009.1 C6 finger domain protein, putative [Talaromyces stipitatus ATCC 10500]
MQPYTFTPPTGPPREGQKNYVFVDEHNRHKRLKVMRACNGCRKRKIKCDAATTNSWPCTACQRLKLVCVPPTIGQDGDQTTPVQGVEAEQAGFRDHSNQQQSIPHHELMQSNYVNEDPLLANNISPYGTYSSYIPQNHGMYASAQTPEIAVTQHPYQNQYFQMGAPHGLPSADSGVFVDPEQSTAENLSEALGELRIDETGIAPYIRQQRKGLTEPAAPVQDDDENLPPLSTGAGSIIRIPPELMPSNEEVMEYFKIFFQDIHPYVPVIHRSHLYQQWRNDRSSISPLLLEALFACAGRMSEEPAQGAQWLALATRHESSFMDVPRLSTIQAMLLLLKARESNPRKGYYYRSWQTIKTAISMSKDLELHEHYATHREGKSCGLDAVECLIQTRVWQTLLVVEVMVGGPQGRSDYEVNPDTVDMRPQLDTIDTDQFETDRSRQFSYFVKNAHHIRIYTELYHKIKRQKDWASDPRFTENNPLFDEWYRSLPQDLQVTYPNDGSPPWLPSHFVGNMHTHYHLAIIMVHRPQLLASKSFTADGGWKRHMQLCYSSAKCLCRLQEAIISRFTLQGLRFMQRGINFTVYAILTCTMLHLVAITSPDPEFHTDARDYFTRHMRILEKCSTTWPLPEIQAQIDALRQAFSADTTKPFELRATFPYGSPSEQYNSSPPAFESQYNQYGQPSPHRLGFTSHSTTPPTGVDDSKSDTSQQTSMSMLRNQFGNPQLSVPLVDENSWDPTPVITSWNMAFPVDTSTSPQMPFAGTGQAMTADGVPVQYPMQYTPPAGKVMSMDAMQSMSQATYEPQPVMTARDWQQSVASVYDPHGLKRRWNHSVDMTDYNVKQSR